MIDAAGYQGGLRVNPEELYWLIKNEGKVITHNGSDYVPEFEDSDDGERNLVAYDAYGGRWMVWSDLDAYA